MSSEPWGQDQPTTGYCAFCPKLRFEGTATEVQQLARAHRDEHHPDLPPPTRRKRANLGNWRSRLSDDEGELIAIERTRRLRLLGIEPEVEA